MPPLQLNITCGCPICPYHGTALSCTFLDDYSLSIWYGKNSCKDLKLVMKSNLGKNVRSKNVRVKHVRLLCKNVRQSSERVAGHFFYPSFTPVLAIRSAKGWVERRRRVRRALPLKKQAC